MSLGMGTLKYEIDKITKLTAATKRLPLFAYLWKAIVYFGVQREEGNSAAALKNNLSKIHTFYSQETVQTLFIILYPLYKNLCLLTGRDPKDIAILLALAINSISSSSTPDAILGLQGATGLNLRLSSQEASSVVSRQALSLFLQGKTSDHHKTPILPDPVEFIRILREDKRSDLSVSGTDEAGKAISYLDLTQDAVGKAAMVIITLAVFINLTTLNKFRSSDDVSFAANKVLGDCVTVFRNNDIFNHADFHTLRQEIMKP